MTCSVTKWKWPWFSWSAQNFDPRNVYKPRGGDGHQIFVAQWY